MHHRLHGLSTYGLNGLSKGDEHPPTLQEGHGTLYCLIDDDCVCRRSGTAARKRPQAQWPPPTERQYNHGVHARERRRCPSDTDPRSDRSDVWWTGYDHTGRLVVRTESRNAVWTRDKLAAFPILLSSPPANLTVYDCTLLVLLIMLLLWLN